VALKYSFNTVYKEETNMTHAIVNINKCVGRCVAFALMIALFVVFSGFSEAANKAPAQKTFPSPEEAVKALFQAIKVHNTKELGAILGPGSSTVISSGDDVFDQNDREFFVKIYETKNKIDMETDTKAILHIGEKDWPMPIPIIKKGSAWVFDTKTGKEEILIRRIGMNELAIIKFCEAYVDAQQEFAAKDHDGDGLFEYSQKFVSTPGKKDGLYWETREGEELSPLGPLAADAVKEGYKKKSGVPGYPYHGYYFKMLKAQGKNASGGAYDYIVNGNMIGGFALVAYPAQYGNSGVMTFIVNHDGIVYQKNLGKNTAKVVETMKLFDPDKTWTKVETE
jgi:hypothetical protein